MIDLAREGYSHEQVLRRLAYPEGRRRERYLLRILRRGGRVGEAELQDCALSCDSGRQVKYSAGISMAQDHRIDWHTDLLQPVMVLEGEWGQWEFPFIPLKPMAVRSRWRQGVAGVEVEAYDETVRLRGNSLGRRPYFPKGTLYTAAVEELLGAVGFDSVRLTACGQVFATDREDWEREDAVFDVVNQLLGEMNYHGLAVDVDGVLFSSPYAAAGAEGAGIVYRADGGSVVLRRQESELDGFERPNVFVGEVLNPRMAQPMVYVYEDDDAASPTSTLRSGVRNTAVRRWDSVADYQALVDNVRRWADEVLGAYRRCRLYTAIMPHHGLREQVAVEAGGLAGVYLETGWRIDHLTAGGTMTHELRARGATDAGGDVV